MEKGLISVIIPCYNGEKYLNKCFEALLVQTYKNFEVIIVNDGSNDKSSEIIDRYADIFFKSNIKVKKIEQSNAGQAAAVNNALKYVNGEFLVWQDCDDYYEKDAFESMKKYLELNEDMDFVRARSVYRDEEDLNEILSEGKSKYPNEKNIFDFYIFETDSYSYVGIFMTRMKYFDLCIKDREIYTSRAGQNWQLILPLAYNGKCGYLDKVVYNYRVVSNSHSHSVKKMSELIKRCDDHKDILFHVLASIELSNKERTQYRIKINIKYIKRKIRIVLSKIKEMFIGGKNDRN